MDINTYGYVILVAALGMAIVFLFLWFLSGLMSLIKLVFGERDKSALAPTGRPEGSSAPPADSQWLIAAATAFLEAELQDQSIDPGPWVTGRSHHEDPWLSAPSRRQM